MPNAGVGDTTLTLAGIRDPGAIDAPGDLAGRYFRPKVDGRLIVAQVASVALGNKGYQTTGPVGAPVLITGVIILCSVQDADVWVRFGATKSDITDESSRVGGQSAFLSCGKTSVADITDGIPMSVGGVGISDLNMLITDPLSRLFAAVDNRSGTNAAKVAVIFKVQVQPDTE